MAAFLRIIFLIPIGIVLSIVVAVIVYLAAFGFGSGDVWGGPDRAFPVIIGPVVVLLANIARYAVLPFLAAIAISEIFAIRSAIAWMLFGGALGLALHLVGFPANYAVVPPLAAGFAAGFAYWLIAGRGAGSLRAAISPAQG